MEQKVSVPIVLFKEKLDKSELFVAYCPSVDISSQGKTEEQAKRNIIEALTLYWKQPEAKRIKCEDVGVHIVNISQGETHAKTAHPVGA